MDAGWWAGARLQPDAHLIGADEQTRLQARIRRHSSAPPRPGHPRRVEHEYERGGALASPAARDVRRGGALGRCQARAGKAPFGRLVDRVMRQAPDRAARRAFRVVDTGRGRRGEEAARAVMARYPTPIAVPLPTQAARLTPIEIPFSSVRRTVLTPAAFSDLAAVARRLPACEALDNDTARPFDRRCTRAMLEERLAHLAPVSLPPLPAASAPLPEAA